MTTAQKPVKNMNWHDDVNIYYDADSGGHVFELRTIDGWVRQGVWGDAAMAHEAAAKALGL
ncbi:hypothetical protein [Paraburkholderia sp. GAS32]|uniref:hypothetical protein n=1 Tax=Paraburkholderia sp. GAS32 TaxID=3035129 RepID=UPI003D1C7CA0